MFVAGDEVRRSQKGNNNAYCQDNEISWLDWDLLEKNADIFRFFKLMINFRKCYCHSALRRRYFFTGEVNERGLADISWHGCNLFTSGWHDPHARALAFTLGGFEGEADIHVMFNMYWKELDFEIPSIQGRKWYKVVDTALASPMDIVEPGEETVVSGSVYPIKDRSVVVLISK